MRSRHRGAVVISIVVIATAESMWCSLGLGRCGVRWGWIVVVFVDLIQEVKSADLKVVEALYFDIEFILKLDPIKTRPDPRPSN